MGRKNYADIHDLNFDLDHESLLEDDTDLLDEEDLDLLRGPTMSRSEPAPKKPTPKRKPVKKASKKKRKPKG